MAFIYSSLRRASASILPRAGGSVNVEKRHLIGRKFLSFSRFSTSSDDYVRLIDAGYIPQKSSNMMVHIPNDEFPFEIEENRNFKFDSGKKYIFRRKYQDEIIHVASNKFGIKPAMPMNAYLYRGSHVLNFEMVAEPNQIHVSSFKMRGAVPEHLKCFQKYLEIRGFNSTMIHYLYTCLWEEPDPVANGIAYCHPIFSEPGGVPFKFLDGTDCINGKMFLERQFEDENIEAQVDVPGGRLRSGSSQHVFEIRVKIVHGDVSTDFLMNALPHDHDQPIFVRCMTMRAKSGHLPALGKFWEDRGIKPSMTNYLLDYFKKKDEQKKKFVLARVAN